MVRTKSPQWLLATTGIAYLLIAIEIIIMISPFALYFYGVYGPILNFLTSFPLTRWTTEFFLPHMVFLDDPLILFISYLQVFLVIGLVLFLSAAIPLYWGRFTKKGVVQISFYSRIRHPQYLFLAMSGFGLMLYWPRFIIVFMYVTMSFVYYLLARNEEWRMQIEHPAAYETYMAKTPMFLPGEPGGKIYRLFFGWITPRWLGLLAVYLVTLGGAMLLAMGIRIYTVNHIYPVYQDGLALVSVFPRPAEEIRELNRKAHNSREVDSLVASRPGANLVYVMPGDFFLNALVTDEDRRFSDDMIERFPEIIEWHQHKFSGGLGRFFRIFYNFVSTLGSVPTNYDVERLVFMRVTDAQGRLVPPQEVFAMGLQRVPFLLIDLDARTHEVIAMSRTSGNHKWGKMPMPTF
jgi:protein-S-isoprenylcysteine O-methyltransferase Ste14